MPRPAIARNRFVDLNAIETSVALGSFLADVLHWSMIEPKWWRNYLHTHSFYEVCFAFAGQGTFEINGRIHRVRSGDVFVAKPNEPHEIISSRSSPLGIYFWAYTLVPAGRAASSADPATAALLQTFVDSPTAAFGPAPHMLSTLEMLTDEAVHQWPGCLPNVEGLARKVLLDTARAVVPMGTQSTTLPAVARSDTDRAVQTALTYLRDNLARPIGVRDVAAQVQLSDRHLERVFQKATGQTILQHLTTIRIDAAAQQLLDRDVPIKQVAANVGYHDVRYFTTLFRKRMNATPAKFRATGGTRHLTNLRQP